MNSKDIFNYIFESLDEENVKYVILHSYQELPDRFESDIDTAIQVDKIDDAIELLDKVLNGTGWKVVQFWRHENYAADCVISNDREFLQVDFCTHYERNGRVVLSIEELISERKKYKNFYIPNNKTEFTYILLKKVLKKEFSEGSKKHLNYLWINMLTEEREELKRSLERFFKIDCIDNIIKNIENNSYEEIDLEKLHKELLKKTSRISSNIRYKIFEIKRKLNRILQPTGMFIVLLGVDGSGKTTIACQFKEQYSTAFRKINHYHSRVRVLKDISQIKNNAEIDSSKPHSKKKKAGKLVSLLKFGYYFLDFLIGNVIIQIAKVKSSLVLIERYYYDYSIDKIRYNMNLSDNFLNFFSLFIKKPDAIFILTGNSETLLERKHEISLNDINEQKKRLEQQFANSETAIFIDTTVLSVEECVEQMLEKCNTIMRGRRKW